MELTANTFFISIWVFCGIGIVIALLIRPFIKNQLTSTDDYGESQLKVVLADDAFHVSFYGPIKPKHRHTPLVLTLHIYDISQGHPQPIRTIDRLNQAQGSQIFEYQHPEEILPKRVVYIIDEDPLITIPLSSIKLHQTKHTTLQFQLDGYHRNQPPKYQQGFLIDGYQEEVLISDTVTFNLVNATRGYTVHLEASDNWLQGYIELMLCMSAVNGTLRDVELSIMRTWIQQQLSGIYSDPDTHERARNDFQYFFDTALDKAKHNQLNLNQAIDRFLAYSTIGDLYDCFALCCEIAAADQQVTAMEAQLLQYLMQAFALDHGKARDIQNKWLTVDIYTESQNTETILGITAEMDIATIRQLLLHEYSKWNNLASHKDPKRREQAEKMLQLIAETRKRYV